MAKEKRDLTKIIHISNLIHGRLKLFVTEKQIKGEKTSLALETEKAIENHISKSRYVSARSFRKNYKVVDSDRVYGL